MSETSTSYPCSMRYGSNNLAALSGTCQSQPPHTIKEHFLDRTDPTSKFVSIKVRALYPLKREVSLQKIKKNKVFSDFSLVKQSRLSVVEVNLKYWKKICKMGNV